MERRVVTVLVATVLGVVTPVLLPGPATGFSAGVCRIGDRRLTEISGMVATRDGYVVVNDGSDEPAHRKIFFLNRRCSVARTVSYPSRPRDTEDLGLGPDGTLCVADIGDNGRNRTTIAMWLLAPGARKPRLHRLAYPDGPHDAEALLLTRTGTPIVVTKALAEAAVYIPAGPLRAGEVTPLRRAGSATVPMTGTSNPFGLPGRMVVTGGAVSPDGRHAVLRTYADAFEYDVPDGDLVRAVTEGTPRVIPLPGEPQGESITYSPDGTALLTVSEATGHPVVVLRYPIPGRPVVTPAVPASSPPGPRGSPPSSATVAVPPVAARRDRVPAGALLTGGVLLVAAVALAAAAARRRRSRRR